MAICIATLPTLPAASAALFHVATIPFGIELATKKHTRAACPVRVD